MLDVVDRDGELLIVLDYIESVPMSALLGAARADGERLPVPIVVRVLADALAGLHAGMSAREARRRLADAIVQLPPKQRIVHEMPFAAIAKVAACSEDSAKANFRHAVAKLRELSGLTAG